MRAYISLFALAVGVLVCFYAVDACNEALCAPLVSKCMLIKCCECDMSDKKNCTCCRACQVCLSKLYTECCSCVGLCPAPDPDDGLYRTSSIEHLPDPIPELFAVLTEEEDYLKRWTTHTYSYNLDSLLFKPGTGYTPELEIQVTDAGANVKDDKLGVPDTSGVMGIHNCSTAFFSQCMSIAKCKTSCKSMGAAKYRWFHEDGCCQCIGSTCLDYGLNEPHCLQCPIQVNSDREEDDAREEWSTGYNNVVGDNKRSNTKMGEDEETVKLMPDVIPDTV